MTKKELSVGELSRRSGLPISTLHFYERRGLFASERTAANHRVYRREILRRVTVIKIAQSAGIPLTEISEALSPLPRDAPPDTHDWERIAENWHDDLTRRIELLTALRDKMAMCIGCGCLSVKRCPLVNADDHLAKDGPGARLLCEDCHHQHLRLSRLRAHRERQVWRNGVPASNRVQISWWPPAPYFPCPALACRLLDCHFSWPFQFSFRQTRACRLDACGQAIAWSNDVSGWDGFAGQAGLA